MSERRIQAIFFDFGETLINFGRLCAGEIFDLSARSSYEYLKEQNLAVGSFWRYRLKYLIGIRLHLLSSYLTRNDFDSLSSLKSSGLKKGFDLTQEQLEELNWRWYRPLAEKASFEPDLKGTLAALRQAGVMLGIVSNTFVHGSSLDRHLAEAGVLEFFSLRLYSYQFDFRKPDRRIFDEAARQAATEPEHIMFVGDRLDTDMQGALGAGMVAVLKAAYTNQNKKIPDGVMRIERLSELPGLVERLNGRQPDQTKIKSNGAGYAN